MSSRSYLSIGDVLTLLRQEFPDVTISKIRFLESQGLVNPERTPSGYRKFYEHDVDRLRWVLRQQREHFLPLKVIKDRLDGDGEGAVSHEPAPGTPGEPPSEERVLVGSSAASESDVTSSGGRRQGRPAAQAGAVGQAGAAAQAGGTAHGGATAQVGGSTLPGIETGVAGSGTAEPPPAANGAPAGAGPKSRATHRAEEDAPHSRGAVGHAAPSGEPPATAAAVGRWRRCGRADALGPAGGGGCGPDQPLQGDASR